MYRYGLRKEKKRKGAEFDDVGDLGFWKLCRWRGGGAFREEEKKKKKKKGGGTIGYSIV